MSKPSDEELAQTYPEGEDRAAAENAERLEKLKQTPAKPAKENAK